MPSDEAFDTTENFARNPKGQASIQNPVQKAGIPLEPNLQAQLEREVSPYKVAEIYLPAAQHVLRIHASQKLVPVDGNPKRYQFTIYAPQLSLTPTSNIRLGVTVVFTMDFNATIDTPPLVEALPGQPAVVTDVFTDNPLVWVSSAPSGGLSTPTPRSPSATSTPDRSQAGGGAQCAQPPAATDMTPVKRLATQTWPARSRGVSTSFGAIPAEPWCPSRRPRCSATSSPTQRRPPIWPLR
jgi:hypothetical protein